MKDFSIVIPVKNAAQLLDRCLESLAKLEYPKERLEVIVADGMSSDNTREVALKHGAKLVANRKGVVVSARNCAFRESKGEIIAFTDADCIFDVNWLKNSLKYFKNDKIGGVGGVTLTPADSSAFEKAVSILFGLAESFGATAHRQNISAAKEVKDIPGCNAIYRREILDKIMPIDEDILTGEDVWVNSRIRGLGYKLILAPDVIVWHYRRSSPERFMRQVIRFAIGRAQLGRKDPRLLSIFHLLAGFALPLFLFIGVCFYLWGKLLLFLGLILGSLAAITLLSFIRLRSLAVMLNMPLVIIIFVFFWSFGFLKEMFFPLRDVKGR